MSIKQGLIKNSAFNLGSYVYILITSFFSISVLLNNLGRDAFGAYLLFASLIPLLSVMDLGISAAVIRRLSLPTLQEDERNKIWQTSFFIYIVQALAASVLAFVILILFSNTPVLSILDRQTLIYSSTILSVIVFVNQLNNHFLNIPQANQQFDIFNSKTLLVGSGNTVFSALLSGYIPRIDVILGLQLCFHIITTIYMIFYCRQFFARHFWPKYHKLISKDLFSFGLKNFVGIIATQIEVQFSKYALGSMLSAVAVTAYSIPQNIIFKGAGLVNQISQAVYPLSASLLNKERIGKLKKLILVLQGLILLGGAIAIFLSFIIGKQFLLWWLKDPVVVKSAYPILKVLSFYFVLIALTPIPTVVSQSIGKPQVPSFFAVLTTLIEIVATLILIPMMGIIGAAYGALISSVFTVPVFMIVFWGLFQKEVKKTQQAIFASQSSSLID